MTGDTASTSTTGRVSGAIEALRPRQWTKNLVLFAGLLFAAKIGDAGRWLEAVAAFVVFSAVSGAAYLVNDVRDASSDRLHPVKRLRPVARGDLSPAAALTLAIALTAAALVGAFAALGARTGVLLACFGALQLLYTLRLKRIPLLDVGVIAGLFVIRAAAGAAAVHVRISPWLLVCTALLALFLGLAKRRGELVLVGRGSTPGRTALDGYSLAGLDSAVLATATATIAAYAAYVGSARDPGEMLATLPFVLLGVGRYTYLVRGRNLGEEPEEVLLADAFVLSCVALWTVVAALMLAS